MPDALEPFSPATQQWFRNAFGTPTAAQEGAWESISKGENALIIAPTGSGKTLAAFLWALDALYRDKSTEPGQHELMTSAQARKNGDAREKRKTKKQRASGTRILYVSPLKALGADVERNLRAPLAGIAHTAKESGQTPPDITVGIRSGDTPARERRQLISNPPDILLTTPESLYLMLTSAARSTLTGVTTVIVDEVHALAGTKRGAHLAVSLERLDQLVERRQTLPTLYRTPAQRLRRPRAGTARRKPRQYGGDGVPKQPERAKPRQAEKTRGKAKRTIRLGFQTDVERFESKQPEQRQTFLSVR